MALKEIFEGVVLQGFHKFLSSDAGPQSQKQGSAGLCGNRMPHLRLAAASGGSFMDGSVAIVGMDLDGELVCRENEFDEQRKIPRFGKVCTAPLDGHLAPGFSKSFSGECAVSNAAIYVREPSLADRLREIRFFGIERGE